MKNLRKMAFLPLLMLSCFGVSLLEIGPSASAISAAAELPSTVTEGDTVTVPSHSIDCDGTPVDAGITVTSPSGAKSVVNGSFLASEAGKYAITYTAVHNGKTHVEEAVVYAAKKAENLFSLGPLNSGEAGIRYGKHLYADAYQGVKVHLTAGGSATFSPVLDFSDTNMDAPLFSFVYESAGTADAVDVGNLVFTLTDVEDPSNSLSISLTSPGAGSTGYVSAKAPDQDYLGLQISDDGQKAHSKVLYHRNDGFGAVTPASCKGWHAAENASGGKQIRECSFYLDHDSECLYVDPNGNFPWVTPGYVVDFDSPSLQGEHAWKGWTSGHVKLTVTPTEVTSAYSTVLFTRIGNYDFSSHASFLDDEAPSLTVFGAYDEVGPDAKVGEKYDLLPSSALDFVDGEVEVSKKVRYVNPSDQSKIDVSCDGKSFTPTLPGTYEITYSASDRSGNLASKTIRVAAASTLTPISVTLDFEDQSHDLLDEVTLPEANEAVLTGGSGEKLVSRTVYSPKARVVPVNDNILSLEEKGDYKIVYDALDYLGNHGTKVVTITSLPISAPRIVGSFTYPNKLLKGFSYAKDKVVAKEYLANSDTVVDVPVELYANGALVNEDKLVAEGESMALEYRAHGSTGDAAPLSKTFPVVDGNLGKNQTGYFDANNLGLSFDKNFIGFTTTHADNGAVFLNALNPRSFKLDLKLDLERWRASGVSFTLEDVSRTHKATVTLAISKAKVTISCLGSLEKDLVTQTVDVDGQNYTRIAIRYDAAGNAFYNQLDASSDPIATLNFTDDGKAFAGFYSELVYFSFSLLGVKEGEASFLGLDTLGAQPLGYRSLPTSVRDRQLPEIYLAYELKRKQEINTTMAIPKAYTSDVLNPIKEFTVSLSYLASGESIFSGEDPSVEHSVALSKYDSLLLTYSSTDLAGNNRKATRVIYIVEKEPPVLSVGYSSYHNAYWQGSVLSVPEVQVSDNSGSYEYYVYLLDPAGREYLLGYEKEGAYTSNLVSSKKMIPEEMIESESEFKLTHAGTYRLRVVAYDACCNLTSSEFSFVSVARS